MNPTKRLLLRAMLAALGLAALMGAGAMVVPIEGAWRLALTGLAAALASGLMLAVAGWVDKPETRRAGLLGMSVCTLEFLGACALIWVPSSLLRGLDEFVGISLAITAATGVIATAALRTTALPDWRTAGRLATLSAATAWAVLEIAAYLLAMSLAAAGPSPAGEKLMISGWLYLAASVLASICTVGWSGAPRMLRALAALGIAAAAAALLISLYGVWISTGGAAWIPTGLYMAALTAAYAQVALRTSAARTWRWLQLGGLIACGVMCTFITIAIFAKDSLDGSGGAWRLAAGAGMIWLCSAMALIVIARLGRKQKVELAQAVFASVELTCPRCRAHADIPVGPAGTLCPQCKLHISVQVHTATCGACGYDLNDLKADRCPECGAAVV